MNNSQSLAIYNKDTCEQFSRSDIKTLFHDARIITADGNEYHSLFFSKNKLYGLQLTNINNTIQSDMNNNQNTTPSNMNINDNLSHMTLSDFNRPILCGNNPGIIEETMDNGEIRSRIVPDIDLYNHHKRNTTQSIPSYVNLFNNNLIDKNETTSQSNKFKLNIPIKHISEENLKRINDVVYSEQNKIQKIKIIDKINIIDKIPYKCQE